MSEIITNGLIKTFHDKEKNKIKRRIFLYM
jgi:hypothetical protein